MYLMNLMFQSFQTILKYQSFHSNLMFQNFHSNLMFLTSLNYLMFRSFLMNQMYLMSQMFQNFKNLMLDQKITLYDWPIPDGDTHSAHIEELLELQAEYISKYIIKVEAPKVAGKHDDLSDALIRMVWTATNNSAKRVVLAGHRRGHNVPSSGAGSRFGRSPVSLKGRTGSHPSRQVPKKGRGGGGGGSGRR